MSERFSYPPDREAGNAARVKALESLLIEKGIVTSGTVDKILGYFETQMGPFNGARIVARAWVDTAYRERLVEDTPAAIAELGLPPYWYKDPTFRARAVREPRGLLKELGLEIAPNVNQDLGQQRANPMVRHP